MVVGDDDPAPICRQLHDETVVVAHDFPVPDPARGGVVDEI